MVIEGYKGLMNACMDKKSGIRMVMMNILRAPPILLNHFVKQIHVPHVAVVFINDFWFFSLVFFLGVFTSAMFDPYRLIRCGIAGQKKVLVLLDMMNH